MCGSSSKSCAVRFRWGYGRVNDRTYAFYVSIISASLLSSEMGLWLAAAMPGIDRWNKGFFRARFVTIVVTITIPDRGAE